MPEEKKAMVNSMYEIMEQGKEMALQERNALKPLAKATINFAVSSLDRDSQRAVKRYLEYANRFYSMSDNTLNEHEHG